MSSPRDEQFKIEPLQILGRYNAQRFKQWSPEDSANWYLVKGEQTKQPMAMYPTMGRAHIKYLGLNQLIFGTEPRAVYKSIKYGYIIDGNTVYRLDNQYNLVDISGSQLQTSSGHVWFAFLVVKDIIFSCFVDDQKIYIYREDTGIFYTVTDTNAPGNGTNGKPGYIASFGNRITVSVANSSQFILSIINLGGGTFNPATCFTNATTPQIFALEDGIIRQMAVLNTTLYIFSDYVTGIWANQQAFFSGTGTTFPWKQNSTYNWNFGIANPTSLDVDFGYLIFLAKNSDGLLQFMRSSGGQPDVISSKAVNTLIQRYTNSFGDNNPFLVTNSNGFLFQYEDNIFYRMSGGSYTDNGILDQEQNANCIEYNFEMDTWHRCIELNGERNRIQNHVYFNNKHLVTVVDDSTVYEMSGQYYYNEIRNLAQPDAQESDAYLAYPFRYERITPIIYEKDYAEFEDEYVQIDFVWGDSNISYSLAPFENTEFLIAEEKVNVDPQYIISNQLSSEGDIQHIISNQLSLSGETQYIISNQLVNSETQYIVAEEPDSDGQPIFVITQNSNTPSLAERTYNSLFKPSIELFWSDDGGISFSSADIREFSQQGIYSWRMRWYQLGSSRNRVYKLICVSPAPIVILGGVRNTRRISGGAN